MRRYELLSVWRVAAPLDDVWPAMLDSLAWPRWWPGLEQVRELERGRADGLGNLRRYVWRSPLWFRLQIDMRVSAIEVRRRLTAEASGDVTGTGEWRFQTRGAETRLEYDWRVQVVRPGMRRLASWGGPLFARSHRALMRRGARGLGRELGCRVDPEC